MKPIPKDGYLPISELLGEFQGANSPFGDDVTFPLAADLLRYEHPEIASPFEEPGSATSDIEHR